MPNIGGGSSRNQTNNEDVFHSGLKGILYAVFDIEIGPKILCQVPDGCLSEAQFLEVCSLIITFIKLTKTKKGYRFCFTKKSLIGIRSNSTNERNKRNVHVYLY